MAANLTPLIAESLNSSEYMYITVPGTVSLAVNNDRRLNQTKSWVDDFLFRANHCVFFKIILLIFYINNVFYLLAMKES